MTRFVVAEGAGVFADALAELAGATVVQGFREAGPGAVCAGAVHDGADAERALLAAVSGSDLVVDAHAPREVVDRLLGDLRTLGPVEHRLERRRRPALTPEQRQLLALLAEGLSLGEAALRLHLSRRTADRRLAAARAALGVSTTVEAVAAFVGAKGR